ncbi:MAG: hypothetical protein OXE73_02060 [Gammaproteobacteria bacterium]|nr:hypothetical protein [Gammaproteobacteria bacterium]
MIRNALIVQEWPVTDGNGHVSVVLTEGPEELGPVLRTEVVAETRPFAVRGEA